MRLALVWAVVAGLGFCVLLEEGQARWRKARTDYTAMEAWPVRLQAAIKDAGALQAIVNKYAAENAGLRMEVQSLHDALGRADEAIAVANRRAEETLAAATRRAASPSQQDVQQLSQLLRICVNPAEVRATR